MLYVTIPGKDTHGDLKVHISLFLQQSSINISNIIDRYLEEDTAFGITFTLTHSKRSILHIHCNEPICSCESGDNVQRQRADEQAGAEARAADQPRVPRLGHDRGRQRVRPRHAVRLRAHQGRPGGETVRQEVFELVNFDIDFIEGSFP